MTKVYGTVLCAAMAASWCAAQLAGAPASRQYVDAKVAAGVAAEAAVRSAADIQRPTFLQTTQAVNAATAPFAGRTNDWNSAYAWGNHALAGYLTEASVYDWGPRVTSLEALTNSYLQVTTAGTTKTFTGTLSVTSSTQRAIINSQGFTAFSTPGSAFPLTRFSDTGIWALDASGIGATWQFRRGSGYGGKGLWVADEGFVGAAAAAGTNYADLVFSKALTNNQQSVTLGLTDQTTFGDKTLAQAVTNIPGTVRAVRLGEGYYEFWVTQEAE